MFLPPIMSSDAPAAVPVAAAAAAPSAAMDNKEQKANPQAARASSLEVPVFRLHPPLRPCFTKPVCR